MSDSAILSWYDAAGDYQVVQFDVCTVETHELDCEITEFPVELAPGMTDQIILKPAVLTLEGYVSDKPLPQNTPGEGGPRPTALKIPGVPAYEQYFKKLDVPASPLKYNAAAVVGAVFSALVVGGTEVQARRIAGQRIDTQSVNPWQYDDPDSRMVSTYNLLRQARAERVQIRCLTALSDTEGLAIESLRVPRTLEDGSGAVFNLVLRQITIAQSETVDAPKPAEVSGKKSASAGSTATLEVVGPSATKSRSVAKAAAGGLSGGH